MSDYEAVKKRKLRKRKIQKAITSILLIIVFILWGIYALLQSDFFNLKDVVILENNTLKQEDVFQISKLGMGRNILKYNLGEIKENVEAHPYIKEAYVERKLPGKITIKVKERSEYAIMAYMGSYLYIDQEGVVLGVKDNGLTQQIPLITGAKFNTLKVGEKADLVNTEDVIKVLKLLEAANLSEMMDTISEINISESANFRLITFDGIEVQLGKAENPAYLMLALKEVLVNLYTINRRDVIIDMRYEGHITVKDRNI
ncbi:cell division protein FtsQ/DivIB [Alkaliphilus hydrothermalis]|uniref:Cell division protein FtsQ n=1 Tax=Alkaliphilus hydrothermalis TaxID=1482730 RepID=A0ABS2NNR4_9FIRM|nr:FtsQ-type POTRA domain-containing protein [Alkaliphilus hydrothermalis]MBM7614585.1 cell division protein FtsQ [Alkaliphilus hydrothermalis]